MFNADGTARLLVHAFKAGQIANQVGWHLLQYAVLRFRQDRIEWLQALSKLTALPVEIAHDAASVRSAREWIAECTDNWTAYLDSENFAEEFGSAYDAIKRGNPELSDRELISHAFEGITFRTGLMHSSLLSRIEAELKRFPEVVSLTFLLGEVVDQGLRPPNAEGSFFVRAANPHWYLFSRQHPDLRQPIDPIAAGPGKVVRVQGPVRPEKLVLQKQPRQPGELPPRLDWYVTTVALCAKIGIQASSVQAACEWANQGSDSENVARRRRVVVQRIVNFCRNAFERVFVRSLAEVPGTKVLPGDTQQSMAEPSEAQHSPSGSGETQLSPAESGEILQAPAEPGEAQQSGEPQQSPAEPGDEQSPAEPDEETDAEHPTKRKGMTVKEANEKAMEIAARIPDFFKLSERAQAKEIGCHWRTWTRTEFFKTAERMRAPRVPKNPSSPKTVSLTHELEAVTGEGGRDEVLKKLIAQHEADAEPSPLEDDPPGREKKVHSRKRL
jgi:hypothetical protein